MQTQMIEQAMRAVATAAAYALRVDNIPAYDALVQAGYYMESAHRAAGVGCPMIAADLMSEAHREQVQARAWLAGMAQAVPVAA